MRPRPWSLVAGLLVCTLGLARVCAAAGLPTDVVPTFQAIHLRVDADTTDYSGSVKVDLEVRKPTRTIQLYAEGEKLERVVLTQKGASIPVTQATGDRGLLTLTAGKPLARGAATLEMRFTQPLNKQAVGLYRMVQDGVGYTFTQFEADDARKAFPCWDEPSFKFPYQVTLEVPAAHQALSNTPVERETTADGWKTLVFEKTPPLPSYLLAIATGPLEFTPIPGLSVPGRVVCVKGQSHLTGLAVGETPRILEALEAYFGRPYPFEKLDLVAVPEYWFGAMENPGAITYSDGILLLDPKATSPAQRKTQVRVTAHELAHMWFGDLVTMAWWDDMWLNESFADWMGDKITDRLMPEFHHPWSELENIQDIMETDARPSTDPIRLHADNGDDAMRNVGLAYNKGKAVLAWFEQWVGEEAFRRGIRDYLTAHEWKNATAADLWSALSQASGKDFATAMRGYIEQQGHPVVAVEPVAGGSVRLTQKRFINYGVQADPLTWQIPMALKYSDGTQVRTQSVLLTAPSQTVKLEGAASVAWVMPNAGARGYYRWSVPQEMLMALAKNAAAAMTPSERIGFLGNLNALLDAGEIHGDAFLQALGAMADEPEPSVASQVISGLDKVKTAFMPDDMRNAFAGYVRRTLRGMADRFGLEKKAGESEAVSLVRPRLMAWLGRDGRDEAVLRQAGALAEKFMADPESVDPSLAGVALQLNALHGDHALYQRCRAAFESAKVPAIRRSYLGALGGFDDPAIEEEALRYALEGPLRTNELFAIPFGIANRTDRGADRAFRWVLENYDKIATKLPLAFLPFLTNMASGCSAERLAKAREFFAAPSHDVPGTAKELGQVTDQVNDCVGLRAREGAKVAAYLKTLAGSN